jgi:hypothetical protein
VQNPPLSLITLTRLPTQLVQSVYFCSFGANPEINQAFLQSRPNVSQIRRAVEQIAKSILTRSKDEGLFDHDAPDNESQEDQIEEDNGHDLSAGHLRMWTMDADT